MKSWQKQCQVQLELERSVTAAYLEQQSLVEGVTAAEVAAKQQVLQQMRTKMHNIDQALKRLTTNQFGLCQRCRQPINPDRLLAMPHAELCIDCQRQAVHGVVRRARQSTPSLAHEGGVPCLST